MRVDLEPKRHLNIVREALLVALLDRRPLLLESRDLRVLEQALRSTSRRQSGGRGGEGRGGGRTSSFVRSFRKVALGSLSVSLISLLKPGLH